MPGHYGDKKKKRPSKMMPQSFPTPSKVKRSEKPKARTGSFPTPSKVKRSEKPKARTGSFPTGQLKMNMKKMPPAVQKRLMDAMKRKRQGMR